MAQDMREQQAKEIHEPIGFESLIAFQNQSARKVGYRRHFEPMPLQHAAPKPEIKH